MKKHIIGFAIFAVILGSFAFISEFLSLPAIPQVEEVSSQSDQIRKETFKIKKTKKFSYKVETSIFYLNENRLISRIKLNWNGVGKPPKRVYVETKLFNLDDYNYKQAIFRRYESFETPFNENNEAVILVEPRMMNGEINSNFNLYALFDFHENYIGNKYVPEEKSLKEAEQVLFIHNSRFIKK